MTICYPIGDKLYINLSNRCSNDCTFCIRNTDKGVGYDLWLPSEPTAQMVIADLQRFEAESYTEAVFCGYGEPPMALDTLVHVARFLKKCTHMPVRINTNGLANLIYNDDI
jgi:TatD family-associated radical SAM protein